MSYGFENQGNTPSTTHNLEKAVKQHVHDTKMDGIPDAYQQPVNEAMKDAVEMYQEGGMRYQGEMQAGEQPKAGQGMAQQQIQQLGR